MASRAGLGAALTALALSAAVLTACSGSAPVTVQTPTVSSPPTVAEPVAEPVTEATPTPEWSSAAESCSGVSEVYSDTDGLYWQRRGTLRDLGARDFARGEVTVDQDGTPLTYTVAPGDVEAVVGERLCANPTLSSMNHRRGIHPGQVLWLTPDPDTPWLPYHGPFDASAGFAQIPYQQAIESAGRAVDAGDVDTVRAVWNEKLKPMFTDPDTIAAVQKVVDSGDLDALRQLFS